MGFSFFFFSFPRDGLDGRVSASSPSMASCFELCHHGLARHDGGHIWCSALLLARWPRCCRRRHEPAHGLDRWPLVWHTPSHRVRFAGLKGPVRRVLIHVVCMVGIVALVQIGLGLWLNGLRPPPSVKNTEGQPKLRRLHRVCGWPIG